MIQTDDKYKEAVDEHNIWVDYKTIGNVVNPGKKIYIDDGLISVIVKEKGNVLTIINFLLQNYKMQIQ